MTNIKKQLQRGFTVVELMIVVVVIGILAALVLNSFAGVQAKARDTQRKTDLTAIATQLEACYNDKCNSTYPGLINLQDDAANGWVTTNLPGLDKSALYDNTSTKIQGDTVSATAQYRYVGSDCAGVGVEEVCKGFTLTAWQEQNAGSPYTKESLNK